MRSNYNDGSTAERGEREGDEPAFVVTGKFDRNFRLRANAQANAAERDAAEPAPTITGGHDTGNRQWVADRPSTNVNGDPRISAPGHDDPAQSGSQQEGAIRVTVQEAAILQGFPPDYPWQGSRTAQFQRRRGADRGLRGD
jgi:DNA (cytosine-5)-methyltransferase 1